MTVKENHTILSRATIRAITITALVAVAAVFSTQNTGVAFGSCPYTPSPGDQADLWLDMNGEDTYFTDAEWPGLEVKTFSLKGPFRGEVNIRTYNDWGLTTSTTSSEISCTTAQSYTAIKNTESMPIYLKRCNWGDHTSLQFGITHERKCILNGTQSYIYPMLITESDMEGTPLTYTTGGEDGRGTQNTATTTETTYTPIMPQRRKDKCILQARQAAEAAPEWQEPTEDDGYIPPVIDVNNIPSDRNEDTLNTWNEVRQYEGLTLVTFYRARDGRYLISREVKEEFGEQQESETYLEWQRRIGIRWAAAASGYGLTQRQRQAAALRESHREYQTRIGAAFLGWENDDPRNGEQQYRAPDGSTVTYQELMQQYGFPLQDKTNHPFYLALAACQEDEAAGTTEGQQPGQPTGTSTTPDQQIPTGPMNIGIASSEPPLNVGQTISYLEAALFGHPKYAGMEVAHIVTHVDPVSGHTTRIITLHGTGGGAPPSTLPANAPTEPTQLMFLPSHPDVQPGTTITPAMSVELVKDFRYMGMTVVSVNTTFGGLVRVVSVLPAER